MRKGLINGLCAAAALRRARDGRRGRRGASAAAAARVCKEASPTRLRRQPRRKPAQQQAAPNQAAPAQAAAAAQASGLSRWMPMLGGLALGGMLGYLFAGNGLGGILLLALLAIGAVFLFRALARRRSEAPQRMQYAGLGQRCRGYAAAAGGRGAGPRTRCTPARRVRRRVVPSRRQDELRAAAACERPRQPRRHPRVHHRRNVR